MKIFSEVIFHGHVCFKSWEENTKTNRMKIEDSSGSIYKVLKCFRKRRDLLHPGVEKDQRRPPE